MSRKCTLLSERCGFFLQVTVYWSRKHYRCSMYMLSSVLHVQYIPRNMHTVFALLCFVVVIHWLIFPYPSGLLHWHCGNLTITPVPAKQPWWIWINTSYEFIMNDCITTTKQSTIKPCAYFLGYTEVRGNAIWCEVPCSAFLLMCSSKSNWAHVIRIHTNYKRNLKCDNRVAIDIKMDWGSV